MLVAPKRIFQKSRTTCPLAGGPRHPGELSTALGCDTDGLTRLLQALCTLGVCGQRPGGHFALSPSGQLLCPTAKGGAPSLRALALWWGGPLWPMWGELAYSVRTGRSAREKLQGTVGYGHLEQGGGVPQLFHDAQGAMTALVLDDLADWAGWEDCRRLVDVGGGHGQVALAMLAAHDHLAATVLDRPHAAAGARQRIAAAGLADRCSFQPGSFFESIPPGADVYLLKSILHNWSDAHCAEILRCCADAVPAHGTLLIVERVRPARLGGNRRDEAVARTDLNMLAGLGGRERSLTEYARLLAPVGFAIQATHATAFEFSGVEAVRKGRRGKG